jgi:hypothetical protein
MKSTSAGAKARAALSAVASATAVAADPGTTTPAPAASTGVRDVDEAQAPSAHSSHGENARQLRWLIIPLS